MTWSRRLPAGPAGHGWVKMCPSGISSPGCSRRHVRDARPEDERQAGVLDRLLVGRGDHAGVRDHGHVGELVSLHEGLDDGEHRGRLRLVAFKGADHQRKPAGVGEQADGDLRLQAAFLGESRLAEPVAGIGLEVQGADVVKDQAGRAEPGMRRARRRQLLAPGVPGIDPQPPIHRGIGGRGGAGLFQHAGAVQLAGRLDDPRQHQVAEHLVPARRLLQPQNGIAAGQGIPQMPHPRGRDRLRAPGVSIRLQAQIELALPGRQPLPRRGLQQLHPGVVMRRPQMVDLAGTAAGGIHDLHRRGARGRLHRPQIGGHPLTLRPAASRLVRSSPQRSAR